jgi:WD40 repeat protein
VIATCGRDKTVRIFLSKIDFACVFAADDLSVSPMFVHAGMRVFVDAWERTNADRNSRGCPLFVTRTLKHTHIKRAYTCTHQVRLWEPMTMTALGVFKGHEASVNAVTFSSDGLFLASASGSAWVRACYATSGSSGFSSRVAF